MPKHSPTPGTPQTGNKAVVATVVTFLGTVAAYWIADTDPFTAKEFAESVLSGALASGLTGGATFYTRNRSKP